jgi:hypothetical protein
VRWVECPARHRGVSVECAREAVRTAPPRAILWAMSGFDIVVSIALGIGLAAASGFRVFLPLLVTSVAAYTGHLQLSDNFAWLGTLPAVTMLGIAAITEVLAYYIPAVDNLLDTITTPAAVIAGALVAAATMTNLPPLVKWATAIIAGGGAAGLTQGVTALLRAKSTVMTGGFGNPVLSTFELGGALLVSALALIAPLVALALVVVFCWVVVRRVRGVLSRRTH